MKDTRASGAKNMVRPVVWGVIVGAVITFLSMLLLAFLLTVQDFPASAAVPLVSVAAGIGSLFAGFTAAKVHGRQGASVGALTGLALFLIVLLISMFVGGGGLSVLTLIKLIIMLLSASIGGIAGVNVGQKRKFAV